MPEFRRSLKVFLCHAHSDKDAVRNLYLRLIQDGVDAWLDKEKLLPGQDWELEIRKEVREADVVVVCLSKQFNQAGFRQKEVRLALDTAMEQPEGEIFIIPARLEECDNLESLRKWHWVDLFEEDGYKRLMQTLRVRADKIGAKLRRRKGGPLTTTRSKSKEPEKTIEQLDNLVDVSNESTDHVIITEALEFRNPDKQFDEKTAQDIADDPNQPVSPGGLISPAKSNAFEPISINSNSIIKAGRKDREEQLEKERIKKEEIKKRRLPYFEAAVTRNSATQQDSEDSLKIASKSTEDIRLREPPVQPELGELPSRNRSKSKRQTRTLYIITMIGIVAIVFVSLSSSGLGKWFFTIPTGTAIPTSTLTLSSIAPSQTLTPNQLQIRLSAPAPTKTNTPTITPTFTPVSSSSILFQKDFENGIVGSEWDRIDEGGIWTVEQEPDGNHYLCGIGPTINSPQIWYRDRKTLWTDYAFETHVKFVQVSTLFIIFRNDLGSNEHYGIAIGDFSIGFMRTWSGSQGVSKVFDLGRWYTIRVEIKGDLFNAYVDNAVVLSLTLQPPLIERGGIGYVVGGDGAVCIDNIKVWSLTK